jgi:hypothetical protein
MPMTVIYCGTTEQYPSKHQLYDSFRRREISDFDRITSERQISSSKLFGLNANRNGPGKWVFI